LLSICHSTNDTTKKMDFTLSCLPALASVGFESPFFLAGRQPLTALGYKEGMTRGRIAFEGFGGRSSADHALDAGR
jgi:hypothetical protein